LRVLQYNILDGCNVKERFSKLDKWIKQNNNYEIIGFNELNDWSRRTLENIGKSWGFQYSYLLQPKTSAYYIGIISKYPIKIINTYDKEFHHGLIHVEIKGIQYLITHLKPFDSIQREQEAKFIANLTEKISGPTVIMGDLNTLSPFDEEHYDKTGVLQNFLLDKKFQGELRNNKVNYLPFQILLNAGFFDIGFSDNFQHSIPTALGGSPTKRRIDYFLVNKEMQQFKPKASVITDPILEEISDHYPVECYWDVNY